jgi:glycosyltransferase involved in cell wall biosynthesis
VDPAVKLVQIGGGEESESLVEMRDRLKLGERVEFRDLPWGQRAADRLASFDLFVLPSRNEGFPVTIMEAMLAGLPVVTTDVGSVREAVIDGETGLIVPPEDPAALAAAISTLVDDPDRRVAMGRRARAIAVERFTLSATVDRYMAVYERVLADRH